MREITLKIPDSFTQEQENFILQSAVNQIESEMRKVLVVPQVEIDKVDVQVNEIKTAMGIETKPIVEVVDEEEEEKPIEEILPVIEEVKP